MKTVLIVTIARSGSSLLAGILDRLGIDMGKEEDMEMGKHLNKYGCYENQDFLSLNMNIMFETKMLVDYRNRVKINDKKIKRAVKNYQKKYKKMIEKYESTLWGFKDASLIYFLPYIEQHFENPYYIHLIREIEDTAHSMMKTFHSDNWYPEFKEKMPHFNFWRRIHLFLRSLTLYFTQNKNLLNMDFFTKVVETGHDRIRNFLKGKKHLTIFLDDLVNDSKNSLRKIIDFLEITPTEEQINDALSFIHPELLSNYSQK